MRTPFGWTLPRQSSLQSLCACLTLWSVPAAGLAVPEQITSTPIVATAVPATATSTATHHTVQIGGFSFDRRVLGLIAMVCVVATIAGRARRGPREPRVRLRARPTKTPLTVLVPPGPTPRLIPSDSPNATRARPTPMLVQRTAPAGTGSGIIDYIAPFAGSAQTSENAQVDYLLESGEGAESLEPPGG